MSFSLSDHSEFMSMTIFWPVPASALSATVKLPVNVLNPPLWLPVTLEPVKRISESA